MEWHYLTGLSQPYTQNGTFAWILDRNGKMSYQRTRGGCDSGERRAVQLLCKDIDNLKIQMTAPIVAPMTWETAKHSQVSTQIMEQASRHFSLHLIPLPTALHLVGITITPSGVKKASCEKMCYLTQKNGSGKRIKATQNFKCNYVRLEYLVGKIWKILFLIRQSHLTRAVTTPGLSVVN